jgi:4-amino-4-deoxy-L-arabinose transferase-like glycosyltransferase
VTAPRASRATALGFVVAGVVGVAIRINNPLFYPTLWGFDAGKNWDYVGRLLTSWELPPPDALWAASHPPLFYYLSALLCRALGADSSLLGVLVVRAMNSLAGLGIVLLAVALVRRIDPQTPRRALLAACLLLFLPVHITMSTTVNEEMLAAFLSSVAVVGVAFHLSPRDASAPSRWGWGPHPFRRAALLGLAAGLAFLTKLSGVLVVAAGVGAYALYGLRGRDPRRAFTCALAFGVAAALVGGWFYARNQVLYGYLYPQGLPVHEVMFAMPPGDRELLDYVRIPLDTWRDPQVLSPDLQRSIWGSTYTSLYFDGHRHFLQREGEDVRRAGQIILILALLPMAAMFMGLFRGLRRALREPRGPDAPLLLLVGATLAGFVVFTWKNPWFAAVKASYLLGLCVPFAFYASEVLAKWTAGKRVRSIAVGAILTALFLAVTLTFSFGQIFEKTDGQGVRWTPVESR